MTEVIELISDGELSPLEDGEDDDDIQEIPIIQENELSEIRCFAWSRDSFNECFGSLALLLHNVKLYLNRGASKIREIDGATVDLSGVRRRFCAGWVALKTALWFL